MKTELLKTWLDQGCDIEFEYKQKQFSIIWLPLKSGRVVSFCEFYKEPQNAKTFDELLAFKWEGETVEKIWNSLTEDDVWH